MTEVLLQPGGLSVLLVALAGLWLLLHIPRRAILAGLFAMYVGIFLLTSMVWPLQLAIVKLIAGGISSLLLLLTILDIQGKNENINDGTSKISEYLDVISGNVFRVILAI